MGVRFGAEATDVCAQGGSAGNLHNISVSYMPTASVMCHSPSVCTSRPHQAAALPARKWIFTATLTWGQRRMPRYQKTQVLLRTLVMNTSPALTTPSCSQPMRFPTRHVTPIVALTVSPQQPTCVHHSPLVVIEAFIIACWKTPPSPLCMQPTQLFAMGLWNAAVVCY